MAGEWRRLRLGDHMRLQKGVSYQGAFLDKPGPRLLGLGTIVPGGGINLESARTYAGPIKERQRISPGEMLVALTDITQDGRVLGSPALVPTSATGDFAITHHVAKVEITDSDALDTRYLYYLLQSPEVRSYARGVATGTTVRAVSTRDFEDYTATLPPLAVQRAIAHILGALDDKIELNRRMSETLEAMARALFKSWFVDFDPARAKMEGRWRRGQSLPGLPAHLYDLFPARLVDSELGEIPEGWEVKKLSDICSTQYGYTASAVAEPVGPKFLRVTDINKRNWIEWGDVPHCKVDPETRASYALELGDLVVARMADPGKSAIVEEEIDAVFASYLVRLKTPSLAHSYFVYGFLKSDLYTEYAEGAKSGSVQANMNAKVIVGASLVVPPTSLMECFLRSVLPLRRRLAASVRESRTLAALRDTLLPMLISGELRLPAALRDRAAQAGVKDAERFFEGAAS